MHDNQLDLLKTKRFLPLFITQFLNAFNDNIFKNALVILITYVIAKGSAQHEQMMVTLAAGIFILPFFIFSATAGQLADKYDKSKMAQVVKFFEIVILSIGSYGFISGSTTILMTTLFLMGTHSAFFGPIKYSILPDHLYKDELISANALIEAGTFLAILMGTIIGGLLIITPHGPAITSVAMISVAIIGFITSFYIPLAPAPQPNLKVNLNFARETWALLKSATHQREVFLSIMGISWFWLVGGTFISQFPTFTKEVVHASAPVVSIFLSLFSIGIAIGSLTCNRILNGEISAKYAPVALLAISIFLCDVHFATRNLIFESGAPLLTVKQFLSYWHNWRVMIDFGALSFAGGIYIVPLYAILQTKSEQKSRARMIACNNVANAFFMVLTSLLIVSMLAIHLTITQIFLLVAILNTIVTFFIAKLLPHAIIQSVVKWVLVSLYRVRVKGIESYKKIEGPVVIIANHTSFLDAMLIAAFLPDKITFAINTHTAASWWLKPLLGLVDTFKVDPTNPMTTKSLIQSVKDGKKVMIFPEGRITVTGSLMKIYEGPGLIADAANAQIVPIRIDGAQYTPFSRLRGKVPIKWFPKIRINILPPTKIDIPDSIKGRPRRAIISNKLYDLMADMMLASSPINIHLFKALINAKKIHGGSHVVAEDIERQPTTYNKLIHRSLIFGRHIMQSSSNGEAIGLMLPNMVSALVAFFGLQAYSRVPAMLNYTSGANNLKHACETAAIKTVYTSKRFVELAKLEEIINALEQADIQIHYLEDVAQSISIFTKLAGFLTSFSAKRHFDHYNREARADDPAVILFTSGSEGTPKGVVLSHANIQANRYQLGARIDFTSQDIVLNALPMFHSFGLNAGTLLPVLSGLKVFLYPSPLHYRIIPEVSYEYNATILFGTDTFLANYAKYGHPYDFYSTRYVIAGAERLKESTQQLWADKLGIRILQGYGATETSPVLSVNTAMQNRFGTVGRLLPGIDHKLENIPGINEGARLWVKGPNIMLGYMLHNHPGQILAPKNGWYDTGDIVNIDSDGYISIIGRAKRFAKIGGEMVSLTAIENAASTAWPDAEHAVIAHTDEQKGEKIVLLTTDKNVTRDKLLQTIQQQQLPELMLPKSIIAVEQLPLLGTGKIDYQAASELAVELLASPQS